ncbi:MAG: CoA transferase [Dehalococcoidia bacterium]|nr:CoA transferase [Dehalococcoidia bacterium]
MRRILDGVRVLDFSRFLSGPYCSTLLADMGAEVIRVDNPKGEEDRTAGPLTPSGESIWFLTLARNKKAITLDPRSEQGREILKDLVKRCDIVVENFAPNVKKLMGMDYETLAAMNRGVILVSISGFGLSGPYSHRLAFDAVGQAMSGTMSVGGFPGNPPTKASVSYVDFASGTHAALGAVLALYDRAKTGVGQVVDIALVDTAVAITHSFAAEYKTLGLTRPQLGNHAFQSASDVWRSKDGSWFYIALFTNRLFRRMMKLMGREELADEPRFQNDQVRYQNRAVLDPLMAGWVAARTAEQLAKELDGADVPYAHVYSIPEMVNDPHIQARGMLNEVEHPGLGRYPVVGTVVKLSGTPGAIEHRAPLLGEHNEEIYAGLLGYSRDQLAGLKAAGIV